MKFLLWDKIYFDGINKTKNSRIKNIYDNILGLLHFGRIL